LRCLHLGHENSPQKEFVKLGHSPVALLNKGCGVECGSLLKEPRPHTKSVLAAHKIIDAVTGIRDSCRVTNESLLDLGRIEFPTPWLQTRIFNFQNLAGVGVFRVNLAVCGKWRKTE
jgi:hypothetical protein